APRQRDTARRESRAPAVRHEPVGTASGGTARARIGSGDDRRARRVDILRGAGRGCGRVRAYVALFTGDRAAGAASAGRAASLRTTAVGVLSLSHVALAGRHQSRATCAAAWRRPHAAHADALAQLPPAPRP